MSLVLTETWWPLHWEWPVEGGKAKPGVTSYEISKQEIMWACTIMVVIRWWGVIRCILKAGLQNYRASQDLGMFCNDIYGLVIATVHQMLR